MYTVQRAYRIGVSMVRLPRYIRPQLSSPRRRLLSQDPARVRVYSVGVMSSESVNARTSSRIQRRDCTDNAPVVTLRLMQVCPILAEVDSHQLAAGATAHTAAWSELLAAI